MIVPMVEMSIGFVLLMHWEYCYLHGWCQVAIHWEYNRL